MKKFKKKRSLKNLKRYYKIYEKYTLSEEEEEPSYFFFLNKHGYLRFYFNWKNLLFFQCSGLF